MITSTHRACKKCGAQFKKSPSDSTVNCPDCREGAKQKVKSYRAIECCRCGKVHTTLKCDGCGF